MIVGADTYKAIMAKIDTYRRFKGLSNDMDVERRKALEIVGLYEFR